MGFKWIKHEHIEAWADRQSAQALLPKLDVRLVGYYYTKIKLSYPVIDDAEKFNKLRLSELSQCFCNHDIVTFMNIISHFENTFLGLFFIGKKLTKPTKLQPTFSLLIVKTLSYQAEGLHIMQLTLLV